MTRHDDYLGKAIRERFSDEKNLLRKNTARKK
jgi:hypothetical protein